MRLFFQSLFVLGLLHRCRFPINKFKGGPVGLTTIATALGEDAGTIEEVYEPFLIKEGFLKRTPRGREVTELAYMHLGRSIYNSQKTLFDD